MELIKLLDKKISHVGCVNEHMLKIAVISDIHGNADCLGICLKDISSLNVDILICLGDILTYGTQPNEVIEQLINYQKKGKLIMIKGNHEEFYFSSSKGTMASYKIPPFVIESINWTKDNLKFNNLDKIFQWQEKFILKDIYFAHANPFEYGDWSYIETEENFFKATKYLDENKILCGVFGHSHRQYIMRAKQELPNPFQSNLDNLDEPLIVNVGSVGQPRGKGFCYSLIQIDDKQIEVELIELQPNIDKIIDHINLSTMSERTKSQLAEYLRK